MKNLLLILMLFMAMFASGQKAAPVGTVAISPIFKYEPVKKTIWVYKGATYTWSDYLSADQVQLKVDSIKNGTYTKGVVDELLLLKQNLLTNPITQADSTIKYVTPYATVSMLLPYAKILTLNSELGQKANTSLIGSVNGIASLDAGGKVPLTQINDALIGAVKYQGTYNAQSNTPALPDATSSKGWYYIVNVDGIQNSIDFGVNDWVISNGIAWGRVKATAYSIQFEQPVNTDNQTTFSLPFSLSSKSMVFYNGILLKSMMWHGIGSSSVTVNMDTKQFDVINIQN